MFRIIAATSALALLTACGDGNPFDEGGEAASDTNGFILDDDFTMNNVTYVRNDPADDDDDELIINNIPFDDPDNRYVRQPGLVIGTFDAYESDPAPGSNEIQYFAVFKRSDSGDSQVTNVVTTRYVEFGYAGAGAQRLNSGVDLPSTGVYSYTGEYVGIRTVIFNNGDPDTINYVIGDANMTADFGDFDEVGAVGGVINNRTLLDNGGNVIGVLDDFISLTDSEIDFDNRAVDGETANLFGTNTTATGNWDGVFAGPDGEELAGVVFVDGNDAISRFRESGGFIAEQQP